MLPRLAKVEARLGQRAWPRKRWEVPGLGKEGERYKWREIYKREKERNVGEIEGERGT